MINSTQFTQKQLLRWRVPSQWRGYLYVLPAVLFLLIFTVYPLLRAVVMSLTEVSVKGEIGAWIGLSNWVELSQDQRFFAAIGRSLQFSVMGTVASIAIGTVLAQLLNQVWLPHRLTNFLRGLAVMPWLFATSVAALMWGLLLHRDGLVNSWLDQAGLTERPLMFVGSPDLALSSLSAVFAWRVIPFVMVMVLAALKSIPPELFEAAAVDGANRWQAYWNVTLPLILPLILTLSILTFVWGVGQFDLIRIITGGGPVNSTEVISFYIYRVGFLTLDWSYGSTISVAVFLVNLLFANLYLYVSARARPWA
jgi:multiple sugar transport system permease protein